MFNSVFKIVYFILFLCIVVVRKRGERKVVKLELELDRKNRLEVFLLLLNGVGMLVPLFYVFSSWLDFADYALPAWFGWLGAGVFILAIWLLYRSHADLGRNWTPTVGLRKDPELISDGVYTYMRHPMYAAHLLWALAQILILHNWIAGYSFLLVQIPFYVTRIRAEEALMLEQFGDAYRNYMKTTWRIFPKIGKN